VSKVTHTDKIGSTNTKTANRNITVCNYPHHLGVLLIFDLRIVKTANTKSADNEGQLYFPNRIILNLTVGPLVQLLRQKTWIDNLVWIHGEKQGEDSSKLDEWTAMYRQLVNPGVNFINVL